MRKVQNGTITTTTFAGGGLSPADNIPATSAQFSPNGLAADAAGDLYIADPFNDRVRKISNGIITTVAGTGTRGFSGDNGPAASAQLTDPNSVAVDSAGNLYIADTGNVRIRKVSNGVITTVAGTGVSGFNGDNIPAVIAQLGSAAAVAVDSAGNCYIADSMNNRIREVSNGVISTVAGNGARGFSGDTGPAVNAELAGPNAIALDFAGNIFIADAANFSGTARIQTESSTPWPVPALSPSSTVRGLKPSVATTSRRPAPN